MERELNGVHGVTLQGSELQNGAVEAFRDLSASASSSVLLGVEVPHQPPH